MSIYDIKYTPAHFYVYAYIRSKNSEIAAAGSPYYIGKGSGKRAWIKGKKENIHPPKNKNFIVILESNLTELGALAIERRYIKWYGRIDLKSGILRNRTDGGEGFINMPRTEQHKHKISLAHLGKKKKPLDTSHKNKISKSLTGRKNSGAARPGILNPFFGKSHNESTINHFSEIKEGILNPMFGKKQLKICCLHCRKETSVNSLPRWHIH